MSLREKLAALETLFEETASAEYELDEAKDTYEAQQARLHKAIAAVKSAVDAMKEAIDTTARTAAAVVDQTPMLCAEYAVDERTFAMSSKDREELFRMVKRDLLRSIAVELEKKQFEYEERREHYSDVRFYRVRMYAFTPDELRQYTERAVAVGEGRQVMERRPVWPPKFTFDEAFADELLKHLPRPGPYWIHNEYIEAPKKSIAAPPQPTPSRVERRRGFRDMAEGEKFYERFRAKHKVNKA